MPHPHLERSPLHIISKAIGRVSLSPIEMTKDYLTNPNARDHLSMLTLDKSELHRLQTDVLNNPDKYISLFTKRDLP